MIPDIKHSDKAFTLMELLIALSLFSVITGLLMSSFFQFQRQSSRMESILNLRQELRILEQIIRKDLQSTIYLEEFMADPQKEQDGRKSGIYGVNENSGDKGRDRLYLHVNAESKFYRNLPRDQDPEIHEVSYYLEALETEKVVFKRREEFYIDPDITAGDRSVVHILSTKIVSFDVKYYKGGEAEALEEWDSSNFQKTGKQEDKIPAGVVITLEIASEDGENLKSEMQINLHPYMGQNVSWR